ncbi:hypothetical protein [Streptomyces sp. NPDC004232]|jgi:type II secretory pathway pseudopilin PulG|uniref:hypothetical protein n=1 Tax=unclassified Streptomyces TaxID=2593676 RepID=UPI001D82E607|nr:hypothetical protein [Streptomyces sp. tea 10]
MTGNQIQGLIGMVATLGILLLLVLPSAIGAVREWRIDRQLGQAQEGRTRREAQKSSSRSTVPSTATWYADGRRSKKFVSS